MVEKKMQKLHGRIVERFGNCRKFADAIGCSYQAVYDTLNTGKIGRARIEKWREALDISKDEIGNYFF